MFVTRQRPPLLVLVAAPVALVGLVYTALELRPERREWLMAGTLYGAFLAPCNLAVGLYSLVSGHHRPARATLMLPSAALALAAFAFCMPRLRREAGPLLRRRK